MNVLFLNHKWAVLHYGCLHSLTKDRNHNVNVQFKSNTSDAIPSHEVLYEWDVFPIKMWKKRYRSWLLCTDWAGQGIWSYQPWILIHDDGGLQWEIPWPDKDAVQKHHESGHAKWATGEKINSQRAYDKVTHIVWSCSCWALTNSMINIITSLRNAFSELYNNILLPKEQPKSHKKCAGQTSF